MKAFTSSSRLSKKMVCAMIVSFTLLATPPPLAAADTSKRLIGSWSSSESDKDTGHTETTVIHFDEKGGYRTELLSSHFKSPRFSGKGRYTIADEDKSGFTLKVDRSLDDPQMDKTAASEKQRIDWLDDNTLKAADGSIVRRRK